MERDDAALVADYRAGDQAAFELLVARHLGPVHHFITRLTSDREIANDLAQEVFVKVWRAIDRFDDTHRFTTWLYTIARRTVIDWSRKRRPVLFSALTDPEGEAAELQIPDDAPLPDEQFATKATRTLVETALQELPPRYREVLILHYLEQLSFAEIGIILQAPTHTVKSQSLRGGRLLRAILQEKMHQMGEE